MRRWTTEKILEEAKRYSTKTELSKKDNSLLTIIYRRGLQSQAFAHMPMSMSKWPDEELVSESQKYSTKTELQQADPNLYGLVRHRHIEDAAFGHMRSVKSPDWLPETAIQEAQKYTSLADLCRTDPGLYAAIRRMGVQELAFFHLSRKRRKRSKEQIVEECKQYKTRSELVHGDWNLYQAARNAQLQDIAFVHMERLNGESEGEKEIFEWCRVLGLDPVQGHWLKDQGHRRQVDIYIPSKQFGIEYCGLYWHTELAPEPRTRWYHYDKMKLAETNGIRLITIFEDEWLNRKGQVKNFLSSVLGLSGIRIPARKCKVISVGSQIGRDFFDKHHIQGPSRQSIVFFGLEFENELVGVISGGRHHRQGHKTELILDRLCFKSGVTVQGGASRLFKALTRWARDNGYTQVISWSDNRISQGDVYKKMGFALDQELGPDYSYVKVNNPQTRFSKQSLKKTPEERLTGKTELQLRTEQGYARIWDCGKKRWIFDLTKP